MLEVAYRSCAGAQLVRGRPPLPFFENQKSALILEKKARIVPTFGLNFPCKIQFGEYLGEKTPKYIRAGPFFVVFLTKRLSKYPNSTKPPLP